ncbi:MAG: HalOD1 output domain-containing protein [Haloarculaceae archaeon]
MCPGDDAPVADGSGGGSDRTPATAGETVTVTGARSFDELAYDPETRSYRAYFDADFDAPSMAVVAAVAALEGGSVTDLDPIESAVDTEAMDALLDPRRSRNMGDAQLSFAYAGYRVTVHRHGLLAVAPIDDGDE